MIPVAGLSAVRRRFRSVMTGSNRPERTMTDYVIRQTAAHRLLKVARTLADLEPADGIRREHLAEALQYRPAML
nr:hypothetical protein [Pseudomonas sp. MG-9]